MTHEYCVRTVKLPHGVHGCVSKDADGFFSVYVNSRDSRERQMQALDHEVKKHIVGEDFDKDDITEIEDL